MNEGKRRADSRPGAGPVAVRQAVAEDAPAIGGLIASVADSFVVAPEDPGLKRFLGTISAEAIAGYIASPTFAYLIGMTDGTLAGVAAIRDRAHLYHLFVSPGHQGRGVGRQLWEAARSAVEDGQDFTVNATVGSVPIYERFGFRVAGPRTERDGIAFVPMRRPATVQPVSAGIRP